MNVIEKLRRAEVDLLLRCPYYAPIVAAWRATPAHITSATMGVSQWGRLYYDEPFVDSLTVSECAAVLEHEAQHLARRHFDRAGNRDSARWNIAADAEINATVQGLPRGVVPGVSGMTAEAIYQSIPPTDPGGSGPGSGQGSGSGSDGHPRAWEQDEGQTAIQATEGAICASSAMAQGDAAAPEWLREVATPRISWAARLRMACHDAGVGAGHGVRSYRRSRHSSILLPRYRSRPLPVACVIADVSGSIQDVGEVVAVARSLPVSGASTVVYADTQVRARHLLREAPTSVLGGGGTDLGTVADSEDADIVIIVTDGYTSWPRRDCVAVILQGGCAVGAPPNVTTVYMDGVGQ